MADKHIDKRTETQNFDMPEGVDYSWTAESQDEMSRHYEKEHKKGK
jgi:hypothetical protein